MTSYKNNLVSAALAILVLMALVASTVRVLAKPQGPVTIETSAPPRGMRQGDVADTVIRLRSSVDLQQLELAVDVVEGLELLSDPAPVQLGPVTPDQEKQVTVRVRLAAAGRGILAIMANSVDRAGEKATDLVDVVYGQ